MVGRSKNIEHLKDVYDARYDVVQMDTGEREAAIYRKYASILPFRKGGKTLLDIGCGLGYKTIGFASGYESVLAVDLSPNAIRYCRKKFSWDTRLRFEVQNAMDIAERFDVVSAFGFSLFNTNDSEEFVALANKIITDNLSERATLIIGSQTDFSGEGEDSWYYHTHKDLEDIIGQLNKKDRIVAILVFPHKMIRNYLRGGIYNFIAEVYKLIFKRKRTFFIIAEYG